MRGSWPVISLIAISFLLAAVYYVYERRGGSAREAALIATLAALAGLSRVPFAAVPSLQPTTFLALISGYVFGPGAGFMVGSVAALVSNFFLGHGPWTLWQMMAWGLAGACGGLAGKSKRPFRRPAMSVLAFLWGFFFGWFMNTWHWLAFVHPLTARSFLITQSAGLWSDLLHAAGNALFMYFAGAELVSILSRFQRRLSAATLPVEKM